MDRNSIKEIDTGLKLIAKSSIIVLIGIFLSKLFTYLYRIIIARQFGPEIYGIFSLAIMIIGWFIAFSALGLTGGLLRYVSYYRGKKQINKIKYIFQTTSKILLFSSLFFGFVLFLLSEFIAINIFHNYELVFFLKVFSILIPLSILFSIFLGVIQAYEKIGWYSFIFNIFQNFVKVSFLIFLIFLGFKSNSVIFSYVLGIFFTFFLSYIICKKYIPEIFGKYTLTKRVRNKVFSGLFSYSWPLLFSGIIFMIFYWADIFLIGYFKTAMDVGFYSTAIPIALLLFITPELFLALFFPLVTKEYSRKNLSFISQISQQIGKWIFMLNLPILILIILFPGVFINILFGKEYLIAENALRFLAIGVFFNSIFILSERLLSMIGKSKLILLNMMIASALNITLGIILIPKFGINGAAFSTMFSLILLNFLFMFQAKHYISIVPLRKKMIKIFLVSIPPILILIYLRKIIEINFLSLILLGFLFLFLYIILIYLFGCLDKNDFMILKAVKRKLFSKK